MTTRGCSALPSSLRRLLLGKNFIYLATVNADGSPQVTPTWVDTDGVNVMINTAIGRIKTRNVGRDPRVSAAIAPHSDPYTYALIMGRVDEEITGKQAEKHIDKLSIKYQRKHWKPVPGQKRVILKIRPHRVTFPN